MKPIGPVSSRGVVERLVEAQRIGGMGDWEYDLVDGSISWSPQVFVIMGRDPALGPPRDLDEQLPLHDSSSAALLSESVRRAITSGEVQEYELVVLHPGGERGYVQARCVPRKDEDGAVVGVYGTVQDISDRKRAERRAVESEDRLGFALDAARVGDWDMDLRTNVARRSLRHDECFGYSEAVPGWGYETFLAHVWVGDRDRVDAVFRTAMRGEGEYDVEFRVVWPDGSTHWLWSRGRFFFDDSGQPYRVAGIQVDITGRRQEMETATRLAAIVHSSADAIIGMELSGAVTSWNPGAQRLFGYTAAQMAGRQILCLTLPEHHEEQTRVLAAVGAGGVVAPYELPGRRADGTVIDVAVTVSPLRDADGQINGVSVIARDVGDRKRMERALQHQALHDALTGLPNRTLLADRLTQALAAAPRHETQVVVLFLDLDHFKVLNDASGHTAGDLALIEVARRLSAAVHPEDTVARFGGDEFVVLCEAAGVTAARQVAERLHTSLLRPIQVPTGAHVLSASIGIAVADELSTAADLLRDADAAMYRAKEIGRSRTQVFDTEIRHRASARLEVGAALRRALRRDELQVYYQPIVALADERLLGFEALVRWQHPQRGLLGPGEFIPGAEETGLIVPVGERVLRMALQEAAGWASRTGAGDPLHLSVNVSGRQLDEQDLPQVIAEALRSTGFPAGSLALEVTETVVMRDVLRSAETLHALRATGVRVSIDDFGTGYSSMSYLKRLPVTTVKIDREFVAGLGEDPHDVAIVAAIIALARALDLGVIAEGVETRNQLAELRRLGCDAAQGYLWAPPLPASQAREWVDRAGTPAAGRHSATGSAGPESH
jgi:diguanylate cyclase (GGDEF)-like protein/PAS domain S-box-containing protein